MTRGNQRDLARAKNLKKQQDSKKKPDGPKEKRMESDAEIMRKKQELAAQKKAEADAAALAANSGKKVTKIDPLKI